MVTSPSRSQGFSSKNSPSAGETTSLNLGALPDLPKTPLFGTDGIRGKAGDLLCASLAVQIGFWAGQVLQTASGKAGSIILGQDSRKSSDMLANALTAGLTSAGLEVWNVGLCPTPCVAHLTVAKEAVGGIMISASHNPPEDNGIKFFGADGLKLSKELQQQIEAGIREGSEVIALNKIWGTHQNRASLVATYLDTLHQSLPTGADLTGTKVVLDLAWGAAAQVGAKVFSDLGAEVIALHGEPDGNRINVNCGSTHLDVLQEAVKTHQADLGFAFDGDADRVMAVDSQGRIVDGDYILYLWGKYLKDNNQLPDNLIIATVMANLGFERAWEDLGGKLIRTKVGDQYVQAQMWETGAKLGGEQSGHIICHHYGFSGDGLLCALQLTALVQQSGVTLAELVDNSFITYPQLLRNVRVEDRNCRTHWQECEELQSAIAHAQSQMGEDGRVLVRASGTEPVIRVMVEAVDQEMANHWTEYLVSVVQEYLGD
jgi:phosphoglucosamine mutase